MKSTANAEMHSHKPGVLGTLPLPLPLSSSAGTDALILFTKYTKEERREWLDRKVPLESGFAHGSNGCEKRNVSSSYVVIWSGYMNLNLSKVSRTRINYRARSGAPIIASLLTRNEMNGGSSRGRHDYGLL